MFHNDNGSNTPDLYKNSAIWMALDKLDKTEIYRLSIQSDQIIHDKVIDMTEKVTSLACAPFNLNMKSNAYSIMDSQNINDNCKSQRTDNEENITEKVKIESADSNTDTCNRYSTNIDSQQTSDEPRITVQADKIVVSTIETDCKPSDNFLEIMYSIDDNLPKNNLKFETLPPLNPRTQTAPYTANTIEGNFRNDKLLLKIIEVNLYI